jgi:subtilisin family serine protease
MQRRRRGSPGARRGFCEPLEDRIVFSIAGTTADFHLEYWAEGVGSSPVDLGVPAIDERLADIHRQSGLERAREQYGLTGVGQTVAVIDSGVAWDHAAFGGGFGPGYQVVGGWDFTEPDHRNPYDDGPLGSHGTHVSGILAGKDGPRQGVAPGVDLVALRVFDDQGAGYFSWVEDALRWVHDHRLDFRFPITTVNLSLGTPDNLERPPGWAVLEDELSVLRDDGVFVAVAAGNSFERHRAVGLSYPAVSPHVTAVMSLDSTGRLSSFSQRHPRAIAAPGRNVPSSVPDYVGNHDGLSNDYAGYSGTSMASPYLAGAAVLVREAMEVAGWNRIDAEAIQDVLWSTGLALHDSATSLAYRQLDVAAAIASVLVENDIASDLSAPLEFGLIDSTRALAGVISSTDDVDYFRFTTPAAGAAALSLEATHDLLPHLTVNGAALLPGPDALHTFQLVAGSTYTLAVQTSSGAGRYAIDLKLVPAKPVPVDVGLIDDLLLPGWDTDRLGSWLRLAPALGGWLTVLASTDSLADGASLTLYDRDFSRIGSATGSGSSLRLDVIASAGQPLYLKVDGAEQPIDLRIVNLITTSDGQLLVQGTEGDDIIRLQPGQGIELTVNEVAYRFDELAYPSVRIDAGRGYDRLDVTGSAEADQAELGAGRILIHGDRFEYRGEGVERVHLFGGGGPDRVVIRDTIHNDSLVVKPQYALLAGGDEYYFASGFLRVFGVSAAGGEDRAHFYGSAGSDRFTAKIDYATFSMDDHLFHAAGFDRYYATAGPGGDDRAVLFGSAGDDTFVARQAYATFTSGNHYRHASGFDRVYGVAGIGGDDRAFLYDSPGNDTFVSKQHYATLSGEHHYRYAEAFGRVYSEAGSGGFDKAYLFDTAGDDTFVAKHDYATLTGNGLYRYARGFSRVHSIAASGGYDRAYLYDSSSNDTLVAGIASVILTGGGVYREAEGFAQVQAVSREGGNDQAFLTARDMEPVYTTTFSGGDSTNNRPSSGPLSVTLVSSADRHRYLEAIDFVFAGFSR